MEAGVRRCSRHPPHCPHLVYRDRLCREQQTHVSLHQNHCPNLMEPNYRRCLSCRRVAQKQVLWRVVRIHPSRQVKLDQGMGRSAYICPQASCLAAAQKKNRLGRALRASVPDEIYQRLWQRLEPCPWSIQRSSD